MNNKITQPDFHNLQKNQQQNTHLTAQVAAGVSKHLVSSLLLLSGSTLVYAADDIGLPPMDSSNPAINTLSPNTLAVTEPVAAPAPNQTVSFDPSFFKSSAAGEPVNVSQFAQGNVVQAGDYRVFLHVNNQLISRSSVRFASSGAAQATPCFNRRLLILMGVDFSKLSPASLARLDVPEQGNCLALESLIAQANTAFDLANLRLDVSIPQLNLLQVVRGYVNPAAWDKGVNAAFVGYSFNHFKTAGQQFDTESNDVNLNLGLNLDNWHLRHTAAYLNDSQYPSRYENIASYAQRDITPWQSQLVIGDTATTGNVFDSFSFRGVQLASDPRMQPQSQQGYAPVIRGVANSNAKVSILQNGQTIYETTVAAGPFQIKDLYPTGFGGMLTVVITEANGGQHSFQVPYASLLQLVRAGTAYYALTAGELRIPTRTISTDYRPKFMQGTLQYGISNQLTSYGGAIVAEDYDAGVLGVALNTKLGALALDYSLAQTRVATFEDMTGHSLRLSYSKLLPDTGTNFAMAAYRYSSAHYFNLQDAVQAQINHDNVLNPYAFGRQRNQLQVSVNQSLGQGNGALFLTGTRQNYWNRLGTDTQFQAGYSNSYGRLGYSLSAQRQYVMTLANTNQLSTSYTLSLSFPLGYSNHAPNVSASYTTADHQQTLQTTLAGVAGDSNQLSYGIGANRSSGDTIPSSNQGNVNFGYRGPYAMTNAGYTQGNGYHQSSFGLSGGVVAYAGGVVLSQMLGDTFAIVNAPHASGAGVGNSPGLKVDPLGHAIVPYLSPYINNTLTLDPKGMSRDVQLNVTSLEIAPHLGAIPLVNFDTVVGHGAIIHALQLNGAAVPFGANVLDTRCNVVGVVGQSGRMFVRVAEYQGVLTAKWGDSADEQCRMSYSISAKAQGSSVGYAYADAQCLPITSAAASTTTKP